MESAYTGRPCIASQDGSPAGDSAGVYTLSRNPTLSDSKEDPGFQEKLSFGVQWYMSMYTSYWPPAQGTI